MDIDKGNANAGIAWLNMADLLILDALTGHSSRRS